VCMVNMMVVGGREFKVAEVKQKYMLNIIDAAQKCDIIDRIVLFGSSIEDRCTESSDIDIAVFGRHTRSRALSSKKYDRFTMQLYSFDDHNQGYDILYFKNGSTVDSSIIEDIKKGEVIYER